MELEDRVLFSATPLGMAVAPHGAHGGAASGPVHPLGTLLNTTNHNVPSPHVAGNNSQQSRPEANFTADTVSPSSSPQTITVTTTADTLNSSDNTLAGLIASLLFGDPVSLRDAITAANGTASAMPITIDFNIPGGGTHTIALLSPLPAITSSVTIDATSQSGYSSKPVIEINAAGIGSAQNALVVSAANTTIEGLSIYGAPGDGIEIANVSGAVVQANYLGLKADGSIAGNGAGVVLSGSRGTVIGGTSASQGNVISGNTGQGVLIESGASGNMVEGNNIGTNPAGSLAAGNLTTGILITGSAGNTIGGTSAGAGNLISGNMGPGIEITGPASTGNVVAANYIGTKAAGATALGNSSDGVEIDSGAANNTIGSSIAGAGNLISGNTGPGIEINGTATTGNLVIGNYLGTNAAGAAAVGNSGGGVEIDSGAASNTIGGTSAGMGNVISGNGGDGVLITSDNNRIEGNYIGLRVSGTVLANTADGVEIDGGTGNLVGGTTARAGNVISGNAGQGVRIDSGASGNTVEGDYIGTDPTGSVSRGNLTSGILITGSTDNTIGGAGTSAGNLISGNVGPGVEISGAASTGNVVIGNYVGTNAAGMAALGNSGDGVEIDSGAASNTIGGTTAADRNIISGDNANGVFIFGGNDNQVEGNFIGTNLAGTAALANTDEGIEIAGGTGNVIGGTTSGARNVISGNAQLGVWLYGNSSLITTSNLVEGNYIGTDATGRVALGNGYDGIEITDSDANTIGGATATARNVISGNADCGITLQSSSSNNLIEGNYIGTAANGLTALGNATAGVWIANSSINTIGGTTPGAGNIIANTTAGNGVTVVGTSTQDAIEGNSIYGDSGLGIDLNDDGVTPNGPSLRTGPNNLQNYPVITSAVVNGTNLTLTGTLSTGISGSYQLDFYWSPAGNSSGYGEGKTFIGSTSVTTDALGNASFNLTLVGTSAPVGAVISATATDSSGNTSEFAQNLAATSNLVNTITVNTTSDTLSGNTSSVSALNASPGPGGLISLRDAITAADNTASATPIVIDFDIPGSGPQTINITSPLPAITTAVVIDGYTQPGSSVNTLATGDNAVLEIQLSGSGAGASTDGLTLRAGSSGSVISGLVINGFSSRGVVINGGSGGDLIAGNFLGTDVTGLLNEGNGTWGVDINGAGANNIVGGSAPANRNVICGNGMGGIALNGASVIDTTIQGNYIGVGADGATAIGNGPAYGGILILNNPAGALIGGRLPGDGNIIANNDPGGVTTWSGTGIEIVGNSIYGNVGLGISNSLLDYPTNLVATTTGTSITVSGTLSSGASQGYTIDFYSNGPGDSAQGRTYLGSTTVLTNSAGNATFTATLSDVVPSGDTVTATTTDSLNQTSEFSAAVTVTPFNRAPTGANNTVTTLENTAYKFAAADFGFSDPNTPPNSLLAVEITTLPMAGILSDNGVAVTAGQFVSATDIDAGRLVFTPAVNARGAGYASFTFQVENNGGTANGGVALDPSPKTMTVNVTALNQAPSGMNNTVTTLENTPYTFAAADFGFHDPNTPPSTLLAVEITTLPGTGTLSDNSVAVTAGQFVSATDINAGRLIFTPAVNAVAASYASFTFQVQNNGGTANGGVNLDPSPKTMTVNVTAANPTPTVSVPGSQNSQPAGVVFSTATGNAITVSDAAAGNAAIQITLTASNGAITLAGTQGLTFALGSGRQNSQIVMTGTAAAVNAAMNGMLFRPTSQAAQLQVAANNVANNGSVGPNPGSGTVVITQVLTPFPPTTLGVNPIVPSPVPIAPSQPQASTIPAAVPAVSPALPAGSGSPLSPSPPARVLSQPASRPQHIPAAMVSLNGTQPQNLVQAWSVEFPSSVTASIKPRARESAILDRPSAVKPESSSLDPGSQLLDDLNAMDQKLGAPIDRQELAIGAALTATTAFTVGYVIWMLRGGMLLTSLLAQMPAWRLVDPLIVLNRESDFDDDGRQETLETIVDSLEDRPIEQAELEEATA